MVHVEICAGQFVVVVGLGGRAQVESSNGGAHPISLVTPAADPSSGQSPWTAAPRPSLSRVSFVGLGTIVNMAAVLVGAVVGLLIGQRLSASTRTTITQVLALCTVVMAGTSLMPLLRDPLRSAVPGGAVFVLVVVALVIGTGLGAGLRLEDRTEQFAAWLRRRFVRGEEGGTEARARFINAFVTTTLLYCIGPMAILGPIQEALGQGSQLLLVKAVLDGIASVAFASSLGVGVAATAVMIGLYQGAWTVLGLLAGAWLTPAQVDVVSVTGGVILLGLAVRLLGAVEVRVGDMVPALVVAPVLLGLVGWLG